MINQYYETKWLYRIFFWLLGYNMTSDDISTMEKRVRTYHRMTEAFKFSYAKRTLLGDPDFVDNKEVHKL